MTHSEEDGRMVSRVSAEDADLLELVRSGFLRNVITAGDAISPRRCHECHRVCTYSLRPDESDDMKPKMVVEALVSQTDIIDYLLNNSDRFDETLKRQNLRSLGLGKAIYHRVFPDSDVLSIFPTTRLLDAFATMHISGRSCLGVVDEPRGCLVDVLSVTDLMDAVFDPEALCDTVQAYLNSRAAERRPLVVVHEDSDFIDVLRRMRDEAVHHVFVVDLEGSPLRVITPTDCLSRIALPGSRKIGWRYDTYDVHPDTFLKNPSQLARPAPGSAA